MHFPYVYPCDDPRAYHAVGPFARLVVLHITVDAPS